MAHSEGEDITLALQDDDSDVELDHGPSSHSERKKSASQPTQTRRQRFWHDPGVRKNWKQIAASIALFVVGFFFLIAAVAVWATSGFSSALVFVVVGLLCFIPGAYQTYMIYKIVQGTRGYEFSSLPYFES
eukprot:Opistho-2@59747